jgi:secondary thiamine-phosphate synthase enzyme
MTSTRLETLTVRTTERNQMIEVTDQIQKLVTVRGVQEGFLIVHVPHTTAAITINENADPDVKHDMMLKLARMIPKDEPGYKHGEGNSDSHLKTAMVGNSVTVLIERGQLLLGRWQGIYLCEFDGPRTREVVVKMVATPP